MPRFSSNFNRRDHHYAKPSLHISPLTWICIAAIIIFDFSIYTLLTLIAAALHEAGHIIAALICGSKIQSISIYPLGADIRMSQANSYFSEMIIIGAGIVSNLIFFLISIIFFNTNTADYFAICNISLAIINALPIKSLDGGEVLLCILMLITDIEKAQIISKLISFLTIFVMWVAAVYILIYFDNNPSLFLLSIYLFITVFLKSRCKK